MIDPQRLNQVLKTKDKYFKTESLVLNSKLTKELNAIIVKLNDEIDRLNKQVQFLQSKIRTGTDEKENKKEKK
jgi:uncharacterized coiled-coil protein SlyX